MNSTLTYNYPGIFIAIDGPNGVGKSKVIEEVLAELKKEFSPEIEYKVISEPTKSSIGLSIREFSEKIIHSKTLLHLVAADREFNHAEFIRPLLNSRNSIVITDRYFSSSLVYQRMHGLSVNEIFDIHKNIYVPDILIILEGDINTIKSRLQSERNSKQLFENPENVETEVSYFKEASELLRKQNYNVKNIFNGVLSETVQTIKGEILNIVREKLSSN